MRQTLDEYHLTLLKHVAGRSTCGRRAVGCIITDEKGHILSTGYNGVPSGFPHCIEEACNGRFDPPGDSSRCLAVHAEQNALLQCSRLDLAHTLYSTCTPCFVCAKMIANTSIQRIVCVQAYADTSGTELLISKGVKIILDKEID